MTLEEKQALLTPKPPVDWKAAFTLVIHGGAGTMSRDRSTPAQQAMYKAALRKALFAGYDVLKSGGEAMDAAVAAVSAMEDCPLFNSGKGAVFNVEGKNELEASIMLSKPPSTHPDLPPSRRGQAATLLTHARNPSQLVRALYLNPDQTPHPFLSGATAESVGESLGAHLVSPDYFFVESRWREHRRGLGLPEEPLPPGHTPGQGSPQERSTPIDLMPKGTVGAVALDRRGCIAACTSTGGRTNKLVGRVGDTPHMGSGFWAEEWKVAGWGWKAAWERAKGRTGKGGTRAVGVSGTGDGDYFIRQSTASTIARRMQYLHEPVHVAAKAVVEDLRKDGGLGGVIALDNKGNVAMPLNSSGMYRGVIRADGAALVAIFDDEQVS